MLGIEALKERRNAPREVHSPKQSTNQDQVNHRYDLHT